MRKPIKNAFWLGGQCWGRGASAYTLEQGAHTWGSGRASPGPSAHPTPGGLWAVPTPSWWPTGAPAPASHSGPAAGSHVATALTCSGCYLGLFRFICLQIPINRHREAREPQKLGKIWPFWIIWICFLRSHRKFKIIGDFVSHIVIQSLNYTRASPHVWGPS